MFTLGMTIKVGDCEVGMVRSLAEAHYGAVFKDSGIGDLWVTDNSKGYPDVWVNQRTGYRKPFGDTMSHVGPFHPIATREDWVAEQENNNMAQSLVSNRASLRQQIADAEAALAQAKAALSATVPDEPLGLAAVVRFKKYRHAYSYAAIRTPNGLWYLTQDGTRPGSRKAPKTWTELLEWIGESNWSGIEVLD